MEKLRVLQIADISCGSGVANFVMNNYRLMNHDEIVYDFVIWRHNQEVTFREEIEEYGGKIYCVAHYKNNPIKQFRQIKRIIKDNKYNIIHAHESSASIIALIAAKQAKVELRICHSHSTSMSNILKNGLTRVCSFLIGKNANVFCACSKEAASFLFPKKLVHSNSFYIIQNAINVEDCSYNETVSKELRSQFGLQSSIVIGHIGRFSVEKNHIFILDILQQLIKKNPNYKLLLIGDGELREHIVKEVRLRNLEESVLFLGFREKAYLYLNAMDILLFPSLFEGIPITLVEAQCNGLPCIISNVIDDQVIYSKLVTKVGLNQPISEWINQLEKQINTKRSVMKAEVVKAGFDLQDSSAKLVGIYRQLKGKV